MAGIIIPKYGGSILRDSDSFRRVAEYQMKKGPLAVVSAVNGVTNTLKELYEKKDVQRLAKLMDMYLGILKPLPPEIYENAKKELERDFGQGSDPGYLHKYMEAGAADAFIGSGECHSAVILDAFIKSLGGNSEFISGYDAGFIFDDHGWIAVNNNHGQHDAVEMKLKEGKIIVLGGYLGKHYKTGQLKAGARNINDAIPLHLAGESDAVEIIKDVPAILRVPKSLGEFEFGDYGPLKNLSYGETMKMSLRGSPVVHPNAIILAQKKGIPIAVKDMESAGTLITNKSQTTAEKPFAAIVPEDAIMMTVEDSIMGTSGRNRILGTYIQI